MDTKIPSSDPVRPGLPRRTLWLMAATCGVCVANICYNQPLLGNIATDFHATAAQAGWVAMASQAGYGLGLLLLLPLGDILERTRLVQAIILLCTAFLALTSFAPGLDLFIVGNLLIGMTAMASQILIPFAVELSPVDQRGQTVGVMMTGLLSGILLARTLAGFVGAHLGWRAMYLLGALMMLALAGLLQGRLPKHPPRVRLSYGRLMGSLWQVLRAQPHLWRPSIVTALSFGSFSVFWTCLAFYMEARFHRGAAATGLFGLVGLAGALAAPQAGRLADRRGPAFAVVIALAASLAAFVVMNVWSTIPGLVIGVVLMDVGVQTVQVSEQGTVLALMPEARSRLNTLYMVARFAGGAVGALAGAYAWSYGRWPAVCVVAFAMNALALGVHWFALRRRARTADLEPQGSTQAA